jgi:ABC-type branched-subunit amino acid transport system ATPase component
VSYGGVHAVEGVTLSVPPRGITGVIGPNGAGKTSLIDAITGFTRFTGRIEFAGESVQGVPVHMRSSRGLVRNFQSPELFDDMTVRENVRVGAPRSDGQSLKNFIQRRRRHDAVDDRIEGILELLGLDHVAGVQPDTLSNGQRKLVGVARAVAGGPRLLLLDEPAAGLDATETPELGRKLVRLAESLSILLIDHDMDLVLSVCDTLHVLDLGRLVASGTPREIRAHDGVRSAYLGGSSTTTAPTSHSRPAEKNRGTVVLRCDVLSTGYGPVDVVRDLSITVREGEIVSLLGPNGAGKTTLMRCLSGLLPAAKGRIELAGEEITHVPAHLRARRGVAQLPEQRGIFSSLTVAQNLIVAGLGRKEIDSACERFPILRQRARVKAGALSGGEQQMLMMVRALVTRPKVILIDELSLGLAPVAIDAIVPVLRELADGGTGILLVEQDTDRALALANRAYVLVRGSIQYQGPAEDLRSDPDRLHHLYLGDNLASNPNVPDRGGEV